MANIFPKWSNKVPAQVIFAVTLLGIGATSAIAYYFTPKYTRVGYAPKQPVAYSHDLHVNQLGLDCRYCHTNVDKSGHANIPAASTCMACHTAVKPTSPLIAPVKYSYESGEPINWIRVHQTPDYVYFNHSAHVNRGVSCVSCHGKINEMEVVTHNQSLSMGFCLDCHNAPEKFIRPLDKVYDLNWTAESPEAQETMGKELVAKWKINPPISCSGCHR
ncbi:MAG: cytochrome c3 family protein [Verrucomicrobiota bacterium]|nr:cytochrome c3 family protein [Verrucomicrobiota bacterium]